MTTGASLTGSVSVRKLQTVLHAKAKEEPDRRFHALVDKVWREDLLLAAWGLVRRNGGAAGVDGETVADIEAHGVERWVGELSRDLREGTYEPSPVRQVLIPKKQPGKFRPLGIPCLRDRVAQTSAMLVLSPIFEADLEPEQYGYRPGRSAKDAVRRVHRLLHTGRNEVIDADLSNYFGEIPHTELMKSVARRVSDGRMLGLIKAWLEMPVVEEDGEDGSRRTNRARKERKGTPQGAPISPLLSNIYMRRFILGWKVLGYARRFGAEIVNYADDFCVLGKAPAAAMLAAVNPLLVLSQPTRCLTSRSGKGAHRPLEPPACPAPAGTAGGWGTPPPSAIANAVAWLASRIVLSSAGRDPTDCEGQSLNRARFALQDRRLTLSFRSSVSKDAICHTPLEGGRTHGSRPAEPDRRSPVSGIPS